MNTNKVLMGNYKNMKRHIIVASLMFISTLFMSQMSPTPVSAQSGSCDTTSNFGTITNSVEAPVSSTYTAWVRLWVPSGSSNSVKLSANTICKNLPGAGTVGGNSWVWVNEAADGSTLETSLDANNNYEIVISGQADGVRVDRMLLLSDNCIPSGTGDNCTTVDTTAPTIEIAQPANGQTVSGNVSVQFDISDVNDTAKVELLVDGSVAASSTSGSFSITWDSRSVNDGGHTLGARLTDKDGNSSTASNLTVNVANVTDGSSTSRIPVDAYNEGGEGVGYHDTDAGNNGDGDCRNDDVDLKAGSSGCILGWNRTGEWLEYDVNIASSGNYTFQLNAASGAPDGGEFRLELDGENITGTVEVPATGSYDTFTVVSKTIELPSGSHTLRMFTEQEHFDVAWLQFVGPGTVSLGDVVVPPPQDDVTSRLSIDAYNEGGEGVGYHDTTSGNLGDGDCRNDDVDLKSAENGCTLGWFATGEWLEYDVAISEAGTYSLQLNTARGESNNGAFHLEVGGNDVSGRTEVPSTGDWNSFSVVNTEVDLPAGEHTLRLHNDQQYFDVAWLQFVGPGTVSLTSTPPGPSSPDETPPSTPGDLRATNVSQTTVSLAWNESVDSDSGVVGYAIYRDSQLLEVILGTSYTDDNLNSSSDYLYEVSALDAVGNESNKASLNVTTEAEPTPPPEDPSPSADLNNDGSYTVADLALYKSLYKDDNPEADFNGDGQLTVQDWAIFLAAWKEGR